MSVSLRFTPVENLLGLRIDNEGDGGTDSPSVIVIFGEHNVSLIGATGTAIDDTPIEDESSATIDLG